MSLSFEDIEQFPSAHFQVNVSWNYLEVWLKDMVPYNLDPDYQCDHVWTQDQRSAYVEYILKGGEGSRILYWNHPSWHMPREKDVAELVDGKQRLQSVRMFMNNQVEVFNRSYKEFDGKLRIHGPDFVMKVACLDNRADVLRWYLGINAGGTPHTKKEINKVKKMLDKELIK